VMLVVETALTDSWSIIDAPGHPKTHMMCMNWFYSLVAKDGVEALQTKSTGSMLLTCHKPHGKKPSSKWLVGSMKQRSRSNGGLSFTFSAKNETMSCQRRFFRNVLTVGATEASRPSKFSDIFNAGIGAAKPFIKLLRCSRIINTSNRVSWLSSITAYYIMWPVE